MERPWASGAGGGPETRVWTAKLGSGDSGLRRGSGVLVCVISCMTRGGTKAITALRLAVGTQGKERNQHLPPWIRKPASPSPLLLIQQPWEVSAVINPFYS